VIPARIWKARIEVPVVRCKHMEISLYQFAAPTLEALQARVEALRPGNIGCDW